MILTAALNHLLQAEPWARAQLAPFAGETLEIRAAPLPAARLTVTETGSVRSSPREAEASLVITLRPEAPIALLRGEEHFLHAIEVGGDARFAEAVMLLARNLRWDAEEDLSRLVGDVAAHRVGQTLRGFAAWQLDAGRRLAETFVDYVTEEKKILYQRPEHDRFAAAVAGLRDDVERLQKRIERLG
jgi:ubiquinone biosynthesis protein UbiJ